MRHIVLWSGGPDSTKCLIDMLENTNDPVIALHLRGDIPTVPMDPGVIEGELNAIHTLAPIIRERYRDFELKEFSHHRFVFGSDDHFGNEIHTFPLIYMLDDTPTNFYIARNSWDRDTTLIKDQGTGVGKSQQLSDILCKAAGGSYIAHNLNKPKVEICYELGDLLPLTWSCIGPVIEKGKPCGKCSWCRRRRKVDNEVELLNSKN